MKKIVVLGAGIAGHTTALILKHKLGKSHQVTVVSPHDKYQWIPSNIWVGIGQMTASQVSFPLSPVYKKKGIEFIQGKATAIHPEGDYKNGGPFVVFEHSSPEKQGETGNIEYDYLVNATGPKLNFAATEGLGPKGFTNSVCTYPHAEEAWQNFQVSLDKMARGEKQIFLIGTGHPTATCQGAAFEYALNVAFEISKRKLNDKAELIWITNENEVGDFGMGGAFIKRGGYITSTRVFAESILAEYGIRWITKAGVVKVEAGKAHYETLDGEKHVQPFDFAMLIPSFAGAGMQAFNKAGVDITSALFAPSGFMKVDADYTSRPYAEWSAADWPATYECQAYPNIFAAGIAFAVPHPISQPRTSKNGLPIFPTAPRTGMPSGVIGKIVALNIIDRIKNKHTGSPHKASMARMGAACIISSGYGIRDGMAASMTVFPIVPDYKRYPEWGRDLNYTVGEPGLAGHWVKLLLHYLFLYKAKAKPFWFLIPE
ncbi:MAG: NAD(P)/FAD-dependent oxidoreductase [Bacteroidales bacterium]